MNSLTSAIRFPFDGNFGVANPPIPPIAAPSGAMPADVEFLNRETGAFLNGVTEGGKKLD